MHTVWMCIETVVQQSCCWSIKPKHGEAGAGSGGDEEDEGGRHRDGQSPHKGLYNIIRPAHYGNLLLSL